MRLLLLLPQDGGEDPYNDYVMHEWLLNKLQRTLFISCHLSSVLPYLLSSLRYHLSVHNLHQTHLDKLDMSEKK